MSKRIYDEKYFLRQTQRGWSRKQYLIKLKGGCCEKCGYNKCSRCLEFHHRNPETKELALDLRTIGNRKWSVVLNEFNKCDLLCANCHREHHDDETDKKYIEYIMIKLGTEKGICLNCNKEFERCVSAMRAGGKFCSDKCSRVGSRKVSHPSKEELEKMLWDKPTTKIAEIYGVSDKAVEKWSKNYGLTKPSRGYWSKSK